MPLTLIISPPRGPFAVNAIFPVLGMSSFSGADENASWRGLKYPVNILRTIETGEFSAVHLIADPWKIGGRLALKCSSLNGCSSDEIARLHNEGAIHRMLTRNGSKYVIKCFAVQEDIDLKQLQLFLEYAENGSLFDMIEPGVGLDPICTQYYFKQLIDGLKYIHGLGIVHRDIKPENLLLMANGTLKISDFGMASVFKRNGVERVLHRPCGSEVYASPQVRDECYRAQPADIWSSGIVLVGMLTGEIPWDAAMMSCVEFSCWVEGTAISQPPWVRIPNKAMDLVKMILDYNEDTRATVHQILEHSWINEDLKFGGNDHCVSLHQRNSGKQAIAGCKYAFRLKDEIISQRHS